MGPNNGKGPPGWPLWEGKPCSLGGVRCRYRGEESPQVVDGVVRGEEQSE